MKAGIPELTLEPSINPEEGVFDRLEIDFAPLLLGINHDRKGQKFADHLSVPPINRRLERLGAEYGRLFCRYTGQKRLELRIRKEGLGLLEGNFPRPLFSGSVKIAERRADKTSAIYGTVCLNPTRFLRYQKLRKLLVDGKNTLPTWKPCLFAAPANPLEEESEFVFDGNDNWMKPFTYSRAGTPQWNIPLLRKYVDGVFDQIFSEVKRASRMVQATPSTADLRYNLKRAEVYWEFADPNPISTIHRLLGRLGTISDKQTWKLFRDRNREQDQQCVICGYKLASGVWLYIYAKTNERIRFELRYTLGKAAKITGGKHTCSNRKQLIQYFQTLRKDAAERLKGFFAFLREEGMPSKIPVAPVALISRVISYLGRNSPALTILEKLIHEKGIPISENSPLKEHLHKLVRHKIVHCRNRVYRLTRDYRNAAEALEQADLLSLALPNCRDRKRQHNRDRL